MIIFLLSQIFTAAIFIIQIGKTDKLLRVSSLSDAQVFLEAVFLTRVDPVAHVLVHLCHHHNVRRVSVPQLVSCSYFSLPYFWFFKMLFLLWLIHPTFEVTEFNNRVPAICIRK